MEFRVLGPLEVLDGAERLSVNPGKQRALLALLLLNANQTVARDRIIDSLWGEDVPDSAPKMVQIAVSQLRKVLPGQRIHTRRPGYALDVGAGELDVDRVERDRTAAAEALAAGDAAGARSLLAAALALWRGPALAEFDEPFADVERSRLEELRVSVLELRVEADLALARHRDVIGELEGVIAQHPFREQLRVQQMLALYRSGRQAEAQAAYQSFRRTLSDELGMEPSASLRGLERRMLRQDADLDAPAVRSLATAEPAVPPDAEHDVGYARSGDIRIAYQTVGDGPIDLVLVNGWVCTFQPGWEHPRLAGFYRRLGAMGRLILFDKRGTGLSDRVSPERLPDLETRMDDVRAVLDAVGSRRAVLIGVSEGGAMATLFAATYPQRTAGLALMGTFARMLRAHDYPAGISEDDHRQRLAVADEEDWGAAVARMWLARVAPAVLDDPAAVRWYTSYIRRGASPGADRAIRLMNAAIDVRDVLPAVSVPTLVVCRDREFYRDATVYMGERIPGARVIEVPGNEHLPWEGDGDAVLDEIEQFLAGLYEAAEPHRVLATVLCAVIDDPGDAATERAHRRLVQAQLARYRGVQVGADGGLLATFDGPARAVRCAGALAAGICDQGGRFRAAVHTGEVDRSDGRVRGTAVEIAAAMAGAAGDHEVLVSGTVTDLVAGSGLRFREHPGVDLGERLGSWRVFTPST